MIVFSRRFEEEDDDDEKIIINDVEDIPWKRNHLTLSYNLKQIGASERRSELNKDQEKWRNFSERRRKGKWRTRTRRKWNNGNM